MADAAVGGATVWVCKVLLARCRRHAAARNDDK